MKKEFCDICGKEATTTSTPILISFSNHYKNRKEVDMCDACKRKLENLKNQVEVDFIKQSNWWKQNSKSNGDIHYGNFKQVGSGEQGGVRCPKCGYLNNSYTFRGICQSCEYTNM